MCPLLLFLWAASLLGVAAAEPKKAPIRNTKTLARRLLLSRSSRRQQAGGPSKNTTNTTEDASSGNQTSKAMSVTELTTPPPIDNFVPAYEGVLVAPAGDAAPASEEIPDAVPKQTVTKILTVECLTKTIKDPNYKCEEEDYMDGKPPPTINSTVVSTAQTKAGSLSGAAPAPSAKQAKTTKEAVAQAKEAALAAQEAADKAKAAYLKAAKLAGEKPEELSKKGGEEDTGANAASLVSSVVPVVVHEKIPRHLLLHTGDLA